MSNETPGSKQQKSNRRTIVSQVAWGVVALACLAPAGYLYGFLRTRDRFDSSNYGEVMSQRAQRPPENVQPPRLVAGYLQPFGDTEVESSYLNGRRIWRATYATGRGKTGAQLASQVANAWKRQGLATASQGERATGWSAKNGVLLIGQRSAGGDFEIFAYEKSDEAASRQDMEVAFTSNDLPVPPRGAEIIDCSGPGLGNIISFRAHGNLLRAVTEYEKDMNRSGWTTVNSPDAQTARIKDSQYFSMLRKGDRHATVTASVGPSGDQLISLVVF
jgi:hypothetical protein